MYTARAKYAIKKEKVERKTRTKLHTAGPDAFATAVMGNRWSPRMIMRLLDIDTLNAIFSARIAQEIIEKGKHRARSVAVLPETRQEISRLLRHRRHQSSQLRCRRPRRMHRVSSCPYHP
jgi:hypothetical protein